MSKIDVSVVIGFKDWGLDRLVASVESIMNSFGKLKGEVIVSDYGSADWEKNREIVEATGAAYVHTSTDGVWSRSRALNVGFSISTGSVLVSTDADMLFTPFSMERIGLAIQNDPRLAVVLQCRDLPRTHDHTRVSKGTIDWVDLERVSRLRPRWGMGGMMAVSRDSFVRVRGFDERMHTYGGEDMDFTKRIQRSGNKLMWIEDPAVRMYHMWHESSRKKTDKNPAEKKAVDFNRNIVEKDGTFIRNIDEWRARPDDRPLVSVAIATFNRSAYLRDSINSVLAQTFQDFEIVIVDDGSTDDTADVVESFGDSRIRYFFQKNSGISKARNRAADESRGFYTAVHDDDDLMVPTRLATSLSAMRPGIRATFGSWVNFDDDTGELQLHVTKTNFGPSTSFLTGQAPGHSTWLVETKLIQSFRYDESISSAIDNNLALRLMRSGIKWVHTGRVLFVRRVHASQVTETDGANQKIAAQLTKFMIHVPAAVRDRKELHAEASNEPWPRLPEKDNLSEAVTKFLPDHLVDRRVTLSGEVEDLTILLGKVSSVDYFVMEKDSSGSVVHQEVRLSDVSWDDLVFLRKLNLTYEISGSPIADVPKTRATTVESEKDAISKSLSRSFGTISKSANPVVLVVADPVMPSVEQFDVAGIEMRSVTVASGSSNVSNYALIACDSYLTGLNIFDKLRLKYAADVSLHTKDTATHSLVWNDLSGMKGMR